MTLTTHNDDHVGHSLASFIMASHHYYITVSFTSYKELLTSSQDMYLSMFHPILTKRRGREAVYEATLPLVVEVLGATLIGRRSTWRYNTPFSSRGLRPPHPYLLFINFVKS